MNDQAARVWRKAWNAAVHEGQYSKGKQFIAAYGQEQYRKGVEAMLRAALDAYYDVDNEKDPDIVMRENADKLIAGLKEKK